MSCIARARFAPPTYPHRAQRVSKLVENRTGFVAVHPPVSELNAFRNAVKTGPVQLAAPASARVSRVSTAGRSQEPISMGSWLFSTSPCRIWPYTIDPHPGAQVWGTCDTAGNGRRACPCQLIAY